MPINRPDGRHWCDPASEQPDEDGQWTCPDDGVVWLYSETKYGVLWETPEQREERLAREAEEPPIVETLDDPDPDGDG